MATKTTTLTHDKSDGETGSGTITFTSPLSLTVGSTSSFSLTVPSGTIRANKSNLSSTSRRFYRVMYHLQTSKQSRDEVEASTGYVANSSTNATFPAKTISESVSALFGSQNSTSLTASYPIKLYYFYISNYASDAWGDDGFLLNAETTVATVNFTLNAPPVISATSVSGATSAGLFIKGISTAKFSSGYARYGGTITSRKLTIGEQTAEVTSNTAVTIPLDTAGTFTPSVQVTDSRGQTTTKTLSDITVIENVPTTFVTSGISSSTTGYWKDVTTASVTVSDISVMEGYRATKVAFTVGSQTQTVELGDGETGATLSILLNEVDTFAPTVKVTDSRGVVTTRTFSDIAVNAYTNTSIGTASLARVNQSGLTDDEGAYALITMDVNYVHQLGNLLEPVVTVTDDGNTSSGIVTWYESWNSTSGIDVTSEINWANYNPTSPVTLYGLVSGFGTTTGFNTEKAFQISVTARDTQTSSATITQTLDSAFYTIDFLAGGHGIAFGQPATQDGFECNMPTTFHDTVTMEDAVSVMDANSTLRALFDFIHPVGSYYETSDTSFDPNTTWGGTWEKSTHISEEESLLYTGSFTAGSITLNDDVKNYWRIAVTANDNDGSIKTFNVINNYTDFYTYLDFQRITGAWYGKTMIATFNGKTMTANNNKQAYFSAVTSEGTYVTVKSIYGYKINTIIGWHRTA